jgi:hypothetical protein
VETLEKKLAEEYDKAADPADPTAEKAAYSKFKPLQAFEKILICSYVNQLYRFKPTEFRNFFANDIYKTTDTEVIEDSSLEGKLKTNANASGDNPVVGTSVFKIQTLKDSISVTTNPNRNNDVENNFFNSSLKDILSTKITGGNTDYQLDSENCT